MSRSSLKAYIASIINTNGANEITGQDGQDAHDAEIDELYNLDDDDFTDINGMPTPVLADVGKHLKILGVDTIGLTDDVPYTNAEIETSITDAINGVNENALSQYFINALRTPTNTSNVFTIDSSTESKTAYTSLPEALLVRFTNAIGLPTTGATIVIDGLSPVDLKNQEGEQIQNIIDGVYWLIKDNVSDYRIQGVDVSGAGHTIQDDGVDLLQRSNLNFIGATVTDDAGNDATIITIGSSNYLMTTFTDETSVFVNHGIGSLPLVDVIDSTGAKIIPLSEVHDLVTKNNYTVTFSSLKSGFILTSIGAPLSNQADIYKEVDATYTITVNDRTINATANTFTITLADATGQTNVFNIKNSGAGVITIDTTGGQTIDGSASIAINQYESLTFQSTGSNYIII